jgi:hypothetical protein
MDQKMKKSIFILALGILITMYADARGRLPCSGSKGGIAHCTADGSFVCNDGSLSQSKRFCSGYGSSDISQQISPSPSNRKIEKKKMTTVKKRERQQVADNDVPLDTQLRTPTCAPLYMASKPGYTQLPICSGDQY